VTTEGKKSWGSHYDTPPGYPLSIIHFILLGGVILSRPRRHKNFGTIVYPESAPDNWRQLLSELKVPAIISPLHDRDTTEDGEIKKPHFHVLIMYDSVKSLEQAKEDISSFSGVGCEVVRSIRGYARYLIHADDPNKYQYSPNDIVELNGADFAHITRLSTDKYRAISEMMDYCIEHGIYSYAQLLEIARNTNYSWFVALCDNATIVMKEYLKSRTWEIEKKA